MDLQELTGYESGVVLFKELEEGFITNWVGVNGIPRAFVTGVIGVIGLKDGEDIVETTQEEVSQNLLDYVMEIAHTDDEEAEIDKVYENDEVLIVTFKGWG